MTIRSRVAGLALLAAAVGGIGTVATAGAPTSGEVPIDVTLERGRYEAWCPTVTSLSLEPQANPYDADTFELVLTAPRDGVLYQWRERLRLNHIDTPEVRKPRITADERRRGLAARDAAEEFLDCGSPAQEPLTAEVGMEDKYGRPLVIVTDAEGRDLATTLIDADHGVPYDGGARS